jgi:DNA polymerase elongation subunit (family B)
LLEKTVKTHDDLRDISTIENLLPILDKRQNSYKVSANSMYGATGVRVGALPFMPIAMCTTYMGRKCIKEVKGYIEELGGRVVYGDTDSNYVTFDGVVDKNVKVGTEQFSIEMSKLWNHAVDIAKEISLKFPDPITLEFENAIYFKFLILTKKRYIYYSCGEDGTVSKDGKGKPKMGKRGVVLSRRDNCKFMKDVYSSVIDEIFDETESNEILNGVVKKTLDLYTRQIEYGGSTEKDDAVFLKDLVVTKSVGDYGGETCTFKPIMGKNDKGEDKWKIGNYVVPLITEDTIQSEGTNGMPMTEEEIKEWYLERLPGQVQLEIKVRRRGHAKEEGQRLSYVVTDIGYKGKQSEKIEAVDYFKAHSKVLKIDYGYYVERLVEPLDQVFQAVFYETENYRQSDGYSDAFKKTKLHSIFAKRGVSSPGNFTKDLHKLCSVTKPKMLNEIKSFSKPTLLFPDIVNPVWVDVYNTFGFEATQQFLIGRLDLIH